MKFENIFIDEFVIGKYKALTPKIKNKRFFGVRGVHRFTIKTIKELNHFINYFNNKTYNIKWNPHGKYFLITMNSSDFKREDLKDFINYVKIIEGYSVYEN